MRLQRRMHEDSYIHYVLHAIHPFLFKHSLRWKRLLQHQRVGRFIVSHVFSRAGANYIYNGKRICNHIERRRLHFFPLHIRNDVARPSQVALRFSAQKSCFSKLRFPKQ